MVTGKNVEDCTKRVLYVNLHRTKGIIYFNIVNFVLYRRKL